MLDILLSRIREEIAIDGEEGTDLADVWSYTSNIIRDLTKSMCQNLPTIDDNYKSFLWAHLRALDSVEFYSTNVASNALTAQTQPTTRESKKKLKKSQTDSDSDFDMDHVSEQVELSKETKVAYTRIDANSISYQQLIEKYGDNIYAIATKELQERQLYKNVPPVSIGSANQLKSLQAILRQRSIGLYQYDLANILEVDQRAAGHYAKTLEEKGTIFRVPVSLKGVHSNLCIHVQFRTQHESNYISTREKKPYNVNQKGEFITADKILKTIMELSKCETSNVLIARDVFHALGFQSNSDEVIKWFNRSVGELAIKGYIKRGITRIDNKGRNVTCLKLTESNFNNTTKLPNDLMDISYPFNIGDAQPNNFGTCLDTNLMQQVFDTILRSGIDGSSNKELGLALNSEAHRMISKILERLIDSASENYPSLAIKRHYEFQGRRKQFRYFTLQNYNTFVEKKATDLIPFPEMEWDEVKLREIDSLKPVIRTRKHIKESQSEFMSSYYLNQTVSNKGKREMEDSTKSDDSYDEETNKSESTGRQKKKPKTQIREKKVAKVKTSKRLGKDPEQETTTQLISEKKTAKVTRATRNSKPTNTSDEEMEPSTPILNKQPRTKRTTRSQSRADSSDLKGTEAEVDISSKSDVSMDLNQTKVSDDTPVVLHTSAQETNPTKTKSNSTNLGEKNKRQTKKTGLPQEKSATQKRTLVDYFGKSSKKQKTVPSSAENDTKVAPSPSIDPNSTIPESSQGIVRLDEIPSTMNTLSEPLEGVQVNPKANKSVELAQVIDNDIVVAEAAPSFAERSQLVQKPATDISKPNLEADSPNDTIVPAGSSNTSLSTPISTNDTSTTTMNTSTTPATNDSTSTLQHSNRGTASIPLPSISPAPTLSSKRGNVNSYSEIRKTVLLDVVEKEQVVEVSKDMRAKFEQAHERIVGKKVTGTICLKTLWKTCLELAKNGDAHTQIIDCTMLNGKKLFRKLLIRKDIDLDGEKFKEEIERIKTARAVMRPINQSTKFEMYDAPVERLQDRLTRMKEEALEKSDMSQPEASKLVAKLSEYESNASNSVTGQMFFKHGRDTKPKRSFWLITSTSHGWLYGRMLRVKCFYNYLFNLLSRPVCIQGVDKDKRMLSIHSIVYNMPCSVFIQIICIAQWTDELKAYTDDPENANKTYEDYPQSIRKQLFTHNNSFTKTVRKLMSVLIFFGLVIPHGANSDKDPVRMFSEFYLLPAEVELWDFRLKLEFATKELHKMDTEKGVFDYWRSLQYISLQPPPSEDSMLFTWSNAADDEIVKSIFRTRNWDNITIFTKEQRKVLSSYVNRYKNYTPFSNVGLCRKIAVETGCTINSVRAYYSKIQKMLDLKQERRTRQKVMREANGDTIIVRHRKPDTQRTGSSRMITRQTKQIFGSKTRRIVTPTGLKEDDANNLAMDKPSYLDNMDAVPVLNNGENFKFKRIKRCQWTKQRDDLLIYSYVILQHRADKSRFLWFPIRQVVPEATGSNCRGRLSKLLMNPFTQEYMSKCKQLWKSAYVEGLESGEIKDDDPADSMHFDLISHLEYFIKRIEADLNKVKGIAPLPASVSLLHDNYVVRNTSFHGNTPYELSYHRKVTLISRIQCMYSQCYAIRATLDEVLDYPTSALADEDDVKSRKVKLIMMLCMMILMTSQEAYDPFTAYKMLGAFDEELVKRAQSNLNNTGCTITTKISRVIPGTRFNISSKFLKRMAYIYPMKMLEQAGEYEKYLAQAGRNQINPFTLSSGMMACITDLISNDKIHITMTNLGDQKNKLEFANAARLLDHELINNSLSVKANIPFGQVPPEPMKDPYIYPLEITIFDRELSSVLSSSPQNQKELIKNIAAYLNDCGSLGSAAFELRDRFKSYTEDDIYSCLERLRQSDPPLLCLVGTNFERYVLTISKYIDSWTILRDVSTITKNTETPLFQNLIAIRPALWTDINGDTTSVLFRDCCQTITGWIMNKPGVTAASLHRFLSNFINRVELSRILKWLVDQKVIRALSVCQENNGKTGLFSKTRLSRTTNSPHFKRNVETSYWVLPGYYNKLSI